MIDIHLLQTSRLPDPSWQEQALESLYTAVALSPVEVNIHLLEEDPKDFWGARWRGYEVGTSEWVTYLDADDWMEPDTFTILAPHLTSQYDSISTKGTDIVVRTERLYPSDRGMKLHRRSYMKAADREVKRCCPSCDLWQGTTNRLELPDRCITMRVGYPSLASEWRKQNGVG